MSTIHQELLTYAQEGMTVFDHEGKKIGKVDIVYLGINGSSPEETRVPAADLDESLVPDAVRELFPPDDVPGVVRKRLFQVGFLKIDTGLLASDRYVLPGQIKAVLNDGVYLSVGKDETLRF